MSFNPILRTPSSRSSEVFLRPSDSLAIYHSFSTIESADGSEVYGARTIQQGENESISVWSRRAQRILNSLTPLLDIHHPNILRVIGCADRGGGEDVSSLMLLEEYSAEQISLTDFMKLYKSYSTASTVGIGSDGNSVSNVAPQSNQDELSNGIFLPLLICRRIIYDLLQGLMVLHTRGIFHGEITTDHCFIVPDANSQDLCSNHGVKNCFFCSTASTTRVVLGGLTCPLRLSLHTRALGDFQSSVPLSFSAGSMEDVWNIGSLLVQLLLGPSQSPIPCPDVEIHRIEEEMSSVFEVIRSQDSSNSESRVTSPRSLSPSVMVSGNGTHNSSIAASVPSNRGYPLGHRSLSPRMGPQGPVVMTKNAQNGPSMQLFRKSISTTPVTSPFYDQLSTSSFPLDGYISAVSSSQPPTPVSTVYLPSNMTVNGRLTNPGSSVYVRIPLNSSMPPSPALASSPRAFAEREKSPRLSHNLSDPTGIVTVPSSTSLSSPDTRRSTRLSSFSSAPLAGEGGADRLESSSLSVPSEEGVSNRPRRSNTFMDYAPSIGSPPRSVSLPSGASAGFPAPQGSPRRPGVPGIPPVHSNTVLPAPKYVSVTSQAGASSGLSPVTSEGPGVDEHALPQPSLKAQGHPMRGLSDSSAGHPAHSSAHQSVLAQAMQSYSERVEQLVQSLPNLPFQLFSSLSKELHEFLGMCLRIDRHSRPFVGSLLRSAWMQSELKARRLAAVTIMEVEPDFEHFSTSSTQDGSAGDLDRTITEVVVHPLGQLQQSRKDSKALEELASGGQVPTLPLSMDMDSRLPTMVDTAALSEESAPAASSTASSAVAAAVAQEKDSSAGGISLRSIRLRKRFSNDSSSKIGSSEGSATSNSKSKGRSRRGFPSRLRLLFQSDRTPAHYKDVRLSLLQRNSSRGSDTDADSLADLEGIDWDRSEARRPSPLGLSPLSLKSFVFSPKWTVRVGRPRSLSSKSQLNQDEPSSVQEVAFTGAASASDVEKAGNVHASQSTLRSGEPMHLVPVPSSAPPSTSTSYSIPSASLPAPQSLQDARSHLDDNTNINDEDEDEDDEEAMVIADPPVRSRRASALAAASVGASAPLSLRTPAAPLLQGVLGVDDIESAVEVLSGSSSSTPLSDLEEFALVGRSALHLPLDTLMNNTVALSVNSKALPRAEDAALDEVGGKVPSSPESTHPLTQAKTPHTPVEGSNLESLGKHAGHPFSSGLQYLEAAYVDRADSDGLLTGDGSMENLFIADGADGAVLDFTSPSTGSASQYPSGNQNVNINNSRTMGIDRSPKIQTESEAFRSNAPSAATETAVRHGLAAPKTNNRSEQFVLDGAELVARLQQVLDAQNDASSTSGVPLRSLGASAPQALRGLASLAAADDSEALDIEPEASSPVKVDEGPLPLPSRSSVTVPGVPAASYLHSLSLTRGSPSSSTDSNSNSNLKSTSDKKAANNNNNTKNSNNNVKDKAPKRVTGGKHADTVAASTSTTGAEGKSSRRSQVPSGRTKGSTMFTFNGNAANLESSAPSSATTSHATSNNQNALLSRDLVISPSSSTNHSHAASARNTPRNVPAASTEKDKDKEKDKEKDKTSLAHLSSLTLSRNSRTSAQLKHRALNALYISAPSPPSISSPRAGAGPGMGLSSISRSTSNSNNNSYSSLSAGGIGGIPENTPLKSEISSQQELQRKEPQADPIEEGSSSSSSSSSASSLNVKSGNLNVVIIPSEAIPGEAREDSGYAPVPTGSSTGGSSHSSGSSATEEAHDSYTESDSIGSLTNSSSAGHLPFMNNLSLMGQIPATPDLQPHSFSSSAHSLVSLRGSRIVNDVGSQPFSLSTSDSGSVSLSVGSYGGLSRPVPSAIPPPTATDTISPDNGQGSRGEDLRTSATSTAASSVDSSRASVEFGDRSSGGLTPLPTGAVVTPASLSQLPGSSTNTFTNHVKAIADEVLKLRLPSALSPSLGPIETQQPSLSTSSLSPSSGPAESATSFGYSAGSVNHLAPINLLSISSSAHGRLTPLPVPAAASSSVSSPSSHHFVASPSVDLPQPLGSNNSWAPASGGDSALQSSGPMPAGHSGGSSGIFSAFPLVLNANFNSSGSTHTPTPLLTSTNAGGAAYSIMGSAGGATSSGSRYNRSFSSFDDGSFVANGWELFDPKAEQLRALHAQPQPQSQVPAQEARRTDENGLRLAQREFLNRNRFSSSVDELSTFSAGSQYPPMSMPNLNAPVSLMGIAQAPPLPSSHPMGLGGRSHSVGPVGGIGIGLRSSSRSSSIAGSIAGSTSGPLTGQGPPARAALTHRSNSTSSGGLGAPQLTNNPKFIGSVPSSVGSGVYPGNGNGYNGPPFSNTNNPNLVSNNGLGALNDPLTMTNLLAMLVELQTNNMRLLNLARGGLMANSVSANPGPVSTSASNSSSHHPHSSSSKNAPANEMSMQMDMSLRGGQGSLANSGSDPSVPMDRSFGGVRGGDISGQTHSLAEPGMLTASQQSGVVQNAGSRSVNTHGGPNSGQPSQDRMFQTLYQYSTLGAAPLPSQLGLDYHNMRNINMNVLNAMDMARHQRDVGSGNGVVHPNGSANQSSVPSGSGPTLAPPKNQFSSLATANNSVGLKGVLSRIWRYLSCKDSSVIIPFDGTDRVPTSKSTQEVTSRPVLVLTTASNAQTVHQNSLNDLNTSFNGVSSSSTILVNQGEAVSLVNQDQAPDHGGSGHLHLIGVNEELLSNSNIKNSDSTMNPAGGVPSPEDRTTQPQPLPHAMSSMGDQPVEFSMEGATDLLPSRSSENAGVHPIGTELDATPSHITTTATSVAPAETVTILEDPVQPAKSLSPHSSTNSTAGARSGLTLRTPASNQDLTLPGAVSPASPSHYPVSEADKRHPAYVYHQVLGQNAGHLSGEKNSYASSSASQSSSSSSKQFKTTTTIDTPGTSSTVLTTSTPHLVNINTPTSHIHLGMGSSGGSVNQSQSLMNSHTLGSMSFGSSSGVHFSPHPGPSVLFGSSTAAEDDSSTPTPVPTGAAPSRHTHPDKPSDRISTSAYTAQPPAAPLGTQMKSDGGSNHSLLRTLFAHKSLSSPRPDVVPVSQQQPLAQSTQPSSPPMLKSQSLDFVHDSIRSPPTDPSPGPASVQESPSEEQQKKRGFFTRLRRSSTKKSSPQKSLDFVSTTITAPDSTILSPSAPAPVSIPHSDAYHSSGRTPASSPPSSFIASPQPVISPNSTVNASTGNVVSSGSAATGEESWDLTSGQPEHSELLSSSQVLEILSQLSQLQTQSPSPSSGGSSHTLSPENVSAMQHLLTSMLNNSGNSGIVAAPNYSSPSSGSTRSSTGASVINSANGSVMMHPARAQSRLRSSSSNSVPGASSGVPLSSSPSNSGSMNSNNGSAGVALNMGQPLAINRPTSPHVHQRQLPPPHSPPPYKRDLSHSQHGVGHGLSTSGVGGNAGGVNLGNNTLMTSRTPSPFQHGSPVSGTTSPVRYRINQMQQQHSQQQQQQLGHHSTAGSVNSARSGSSSSSHTSSSGNNNINGIGAGGGKHAQNSMPSKGNGVYPVPLGLGQVQNHSSSSQTAPGLNIGFTSSSSFTTHGSLPSHGSLGSSSFSNMNPSHASHTLPLSPGSASGSLTFSVNQNGFSLLPGTSLGPLNGSTAGCKVPSSSQSNSNSSLGSTSSSSTHPSNITPVQQSPYVSPHPEFSSVHSQSQISSPPGGRTQSRASSIGSSQHPFTQGTGTPSQGAGTPNSGHTAQFSPNSNSNSVLHSPGYHSGFNSHQNSRHTSLSSSSHSSLHSRSNYSHGSFSNAGQIGLSNSQHSSSMNLRKTDESLSNMNMNTPGAIAVGASNQQASVGVPASSVSPPPPASLGVNTNSYQPSAGPMLNLLSTSDSFREGYGALVKSRQGRTVQPQNPATVPSFGTGSQFMGSMGHVHSFNLGAVLNQNSLNSMGQGNSTLFYPSGVGSGNEGHGMSTVGSLPHIGIGIGLGLGGMSSGHGLGEIPSTADNSFLIANSIPPGPNTANTISSTTTSPNSANVNFTTTNNGTNSTPSAKIDNLAPEVIVESPVCSDDESPGAVSTLKD